MSQIYYWNLCLDCKEIQPVHSEGDQPWDFFGRSDAKAEAPVLWTPHVKSWLIGKDWCWERLGQEEKGTTEDEMAGWHHGLDGHGSECTLGVGDGQGGLACCDSWGRKESDTTERLNWTELKRTKGNIKICKRKVQVRLLWGFFGSYNNLFNAPVVHFLCNQYLIFWLGKEATRDESVNAKPALNI